MSTANLVLSFCGPALMLVLLFILVRRTLYKRFPVFFAYCLSILVVQLLRYLVVGQRTPYFFVYWITEGCYLVIALLAILSVLRPLTQLEYVRHPWSRFLLVPIVLLIVATSLWTAFVKPIDKPAAGRFATGIYVFVILMSLVEFLLFLVSFRVRGRYPIKWTQYEFGILKGYGALTALNLVSYVALVLRLLRITVGPQLEHIFLAFPVGAFIASATAWLIAFWTPQAPHDESPDIGGFPDVLRVVLEQYHAHAEFVRKVAKHLGDRFVAFAN